MDMPRQNESLRHPPFRRQRQHNNNQNVQLHFSEEKMTLINAIFTNFEEKPRNKVAIRHLPPELTPHEFLASLRNCFACTPQHAPVLDEIRWMHLNVGTVRSGEQPAPSTAYIFFSAKNFAMTFVNRYDGHLFVDRHATEYRANVAHAPYQRMLISPANQPGNPKFHLADSYSKPQAISYYLDQPAELLRIALPSSDKKARTIETDPVYIKFLAQQADSPKGSKSKEIQNPKADQDDNKGAAIVSPLVQALIDRRSNPNYNHRSKAPNTPSTGDSRKQQARASRNPNKDPRSAKQTQTREQNQPVRGNSTTRRRTRGSNRPGPCWRPKRKAGSETPNQRDVRKSLSS